MINTVSKMTFAAAGSLSASANNQDAAYVLVSLNRAPRSDDYLQVQFMPVHGKTVNIINRISMKALASISDIERGHSNALQEVLNGLTTTDYVGYSFAVPVGALRLKAQPGTLEFAVDAGAAGIMSISLVKGEKAGDHWLEWKQVNLVSGQVDRCRRLYGYQPTAVVDPSGKDISFQITTADGQTVANAMDIFGATAVFGQIEAEAPRYAVALFEGDDEIEEAVSWNITGNDVAGWSVIAVLVGRDLGRVLASHKADAGHQARKIEALGTEQAHALAAAQVKPHFSS